MERRGAAEVVAVDVLDPLRWDWPARLAAGGDRGDRRTSGAAFDVARDGARLARRAARPVASTSSRPDVVGTFDVVYCGSLTLHLRDPVGALERDPLGVPGVLVYEDAIDVALSLLRRRTPRAVLDGRGRPWWWKAQRRRRSRASPRRRASRSSPGPMRFGCRSAPAAAPRSLSRCGRAGREQALLAWRGDPHAALLAR